MNEKDSMGKCYFEALLAIADLNLSEFIGSDDSLSDLEADLNAFILDLPKIETKIKGFLETDDRDLTIECYKTLCKSLEKIHADSLASEFSKQTDALKSMKPEKFNSYMNYFMMSASSLSIDIQVAKNSADKQETKQETKETQEGTGAKLILAVAFSYDAKNRL